MQEEYVVSYDKDLNIIETICRGTVTTETLSSTSDKSTELSLKNNCFKFLVDLSNCNLQASFADAFRQTASYKQEPQYRQVSRIAVILPKQMDPQAQEKVIFYKDVAAEENWAVELFETREEALKWLHKEE